MTQSEVAHGDELASVGVTTIAHESGKWHCHTTLEKYNGDSTDPADLYERVEIENNVLTTGGVAALLSRLIGSTAVGAFNNASAAIGVGNGTDAAVTGDTDLKGANKLRKGMDANYPSHTDSTSDVGAKTVTFRATFGTTEANYTWSEWGVFNSVATTGAGLNRMLNRRQQALGTKVAGATWVLTVAITIN